MEPEKTIQPADTEAGAGKTDHSGHRERMRQRYRQGGLTECKEHEVLEMLLYRNFTRGNTNPLAHALLEKAGSIERVLEGDVSAAGAGEKTRALLRETGENIQECFVQAVLQAISQQPDRLPDREQFYMLSLWFLRRYPDRVLFLVQGEAGEQPEAATIGNTDLLTVGGELYKALSGEKGGEKRFCLACMGKREDMAALRKSEAGQSAKLLLTITNRWEAVWL